MNSKPRPWRDFFAAVVEAVLPETPERRAVREREDLKRELRANRVPTNDENGRTEE
ncbi:hypothetical protein DER29_0518 [Micromonospora sp. M71_S20]|uniref:hypothetical protein n=1 Tax=Micromonospora sp. M71_S20 TaxID=592872 RepID=UPI000F0E03E8|nr:hypothetical protein [Micromonospora sp. M71_S20]RLK22679.1 hypothetical protein DER29_0518 [Micromonospora sp. M71_S20]